MLERERERERERESPTPHTLPLSTEIVQGVGPITHTHEVLI